MPLNVETLFLAPGPQPNALQATAEGLWILDQGTNEVHLVSYTGEVLRQFPTASDRGSGITDDGQNLWIASTYSREILKVDRQTGATLAAFATPGAGETGAHGLEWQDGALWMAVPPSATLYHVEPEVDEIASQGRHGGLPLPVRHAVPAPGNRPHGIAWHGDRLWCAETSHRALYLLNLLDGTIEDGIELPAPHPEPHGMTAWDGALWYCDATSRAVCRIRL